MSKKSNLVPYRIAKKLNRLGYKIDHEYYFLTEDYRSLGLSEGDVSASYFSEDVTIPAPFLLDTLEWFRVNKYIHITVLEENEGCYTWYINWMGKVIESKSILETPHYNPIEALLEGLERAIEVTKEVIISPSEFADLPDNYGTMFIIGEEWDDKYIKIIRKDIELWRMITYKSSVIIKDVYEVTREDVLHEIREIL